MSDTVEGVVAPPTRASPKKGKASPASKKKGSSATKNPTHPPTAKMVVSAIAALKERGGSSNQAIKKYITSTYKIDAEKLAPFIKKYLKAAVVAGTLLQTKGKGASGSFKLAKASPEAATAKKPRSTKKAVAEKKTKTAGTPKKKVKMVAVKAKKTTKTPTKPKVPKVKKTNANKASTVKKTPAVKKAPAKPKKATATKKPAPSRKSAATKKPAKK